MPDKQEKINGKNMLDMKEPHKLYNLVIGLSGPYGSGCSSLAEELVQIINDWPGCRAQKIQVSTLIEFWHKKLLHKTNDGEATDVTRRKNLQDAGNALRAKQKELIGNLITNDIVLDAKLQENKEDIAEIGTLVYVVDSLKNYSDLESLRKIYKDEFFFCFVNANNEIRWRRMRDYKSWKEEDKSNFQKLDIIDSDEKQINPEVEGIGQQVKKLAAHADYYFVNNSTREDLRTLAYRLVTLLFGLGISQPTNEEKCMHIAFSSANQSACLSRQVGAAIFTKEGNILSIGHNDVPKSKGGLYSIEDGKHDHRCLNVGDRRCISDTNKEERFNALTSNLNDQLNEFFKKKLSKKLFDSVKQLFSDTEEDNIKLLLSSLVKNSEFKDATEYSRAVHAEMDALLSVCRNLSGSTIGATVYVTTQPCHNCVKHLICAGVQKVIYIEPYPKSLGEELHSDAITMNPQSDSASENKVCFHPYQGLSPRRYHDIFDMAEKRKDNEGKMCYRSKQDKAFQPKFSKKVAKRTRIDSGPSKNLISVNELRALKKIATILASSTGGEGEHEAN